MFVDDHTHHDERVIYALIYTCSYIYIYVKSYIYTRPAYVHIYKRSVCFSHEVTTTSRVRNGGYWSACIYNMCVCVCVYYVWRVQHCTRRTYYITSTQISTAGPRFIMLVKQIGSARMFYVIVRNAAEISPITIIITIELHKLQKKK